MMRAIEAMRDFGKEYLLSDSDTDELEKQLSDNTVVGGIAWRQLKHKLKDVSFDKKDLMKMLTDAEKDTLNQLEQL